MNKQPLLIQDAYAFEPPPPKVREAPWEKLYRFFFGDDVFISYSRADAIRYVPSLAARLAAKRHICFFDQLAADPSEDLPERLKKKILRSTVFVLVGTRGAVASSAVRKEVELFRRTRRPFIPVDVDGALVEQENWRDVIGTAKIREEGARVRDGDPSPEVVNLIKDSFRYTRRSQWLRASLLAGFSVILITVVLSLFLIRSASASAAAIRQQAASDVAAAKKEADETRQSALNSRAEADRATADADAARRQAEVANTSAEVASTRREVAEHAMRRAQELERQSAERAAETSRREAGSRAALLAREPGRESEALALAVEAADQSVAHGGDLPKEVLDGITASAMAADYSLLLEDTGARDAPEMTISPDGEKILGTFTNPRVGTTRWVLWDGRTGKITFDTSTPGLVWKSSFSRDGKRLAALMSIPLGLSVWDLNGSRVRPVQTACGVGKNIYAIGDLALDSDGSHVIINGSAYNSSGRLSHHTTVCELDTGREEILTSPFPLSVVDVAFTPEDEPALYGAPISPEGSQTVPLIYFPRSGRVVELKADGPRLNLNFFGGIGSDGSAITITRDFDVQGRDRVYVQSTDGYVQRLTGYRGMVVSVAYVNKLARVVTITGRSIRVCDARFLPNFAALRGPVRQPVVAAFSPDNLTVLTVSDDGRGRLWDVQMGRLRHTLPIGDEFLDESKDYNRMKRLGFSTAAFRADGKRLVTSNEHGEIQTWDVETGRAICPEPGRRTTDAEYLAGVSFLVGGDYVLAIYSRGMGYGPSIDFLDAQTCRLAGTFNFDEPLRIFSMAKDGTAIITGAATQQPIAYKVDTDFPEWERPQLKTWSLRGIDLRSGAPIRLTSSNLGESPGILNGLSSDGTQVLVAMKDDSLQIWRPREASSVRLERWQDGWPKRFLSGFSDDGARVVALLPEEVLVWDTRSGKLLLAFKTDVDVSDWVGASLSPDGSKLLIVGKDHVTRIYPTTPEGFLGAARHLLGR